MAFTILPRLEEKILRQYAANMAMYPQKQAEVAAWLENQDTCHGLCLKFLYGHLPVLDMVSFPVETLAGYVTAALQAYEEIPYVQQIPQEIFLSYVVNHRVNSECLDGSRQALYAAIKPHIEGKTMEEAALAVNYWCYSQATYTPSDDRTLGPLSVMRRSLGRCGEESVLCVAAMRSVGIPARQCYAPRWSHCDDNHAWVEVWIDGKWRYLGACEPEPGLDRGWFTAASSRAMLVHSKCWSDFGDAADVAYRTPLYGLVNCTGTYAETRVLSVRVTEQHVPLANVRVQFQIVNYSELVSIYEAVTDGQGIARFETGLGDLCVYVCHNDRICLQKVDMRQQDSLDLELRDGYTVQTLPERMEMDLVPPVGRSDVAAETEDAAHEEKKRRCESVRNAYKNTFWTCDHGTVSDMARREAAGNLPQIQRFLDAPGYTLAEKEQILSTLRKKDFVDITCEVLFDALDNSRAARDRYPEDIFRKYILAPRVADEMLQPQRAKLRALFPQGFPDAGAIAAWMGENMEILPDHQVDNYYPSAYGCLYYRQTAGFCFDMVFVCLCRAFCFPARLAPDTGEGQWLDGEGNWHSIRAHGDVPTVTLTLETESGRACHYFEHFSIGRWNGHSFDSLQYWELSIEERGDFRVRPGLYRLITTTRQIDGTASALLRHFRVEADRTVVLQFPGDQTAQRLKQVPLLDALPEGPVKSCLEETTGTRRILIFADPGSEPTEHLLQELLECADAYNRKDCRLHIFLGKPEDLKDATVQKVIQQLHAVQTQVLRDPQAEAALHRIMQVGDLRLPFVVSVDHRDLGVYATANYNIRMAQTLLLIQKLISK